MDFFNKTAELTHSHESEQTIENLKRVKEHLEQDNHLYDLFKQSAVGIGIIATNGRWLKANKKVCDVFSYSEEELFDKHLNIMRHPDDSQANLEQIQRLLNGEIENVWLDICYNSRYNIKGWISFHSTLIYDKSNSPLYYLCIIEDITERKMAFEKLNMRNAELVQINDKLNTEKKGLEKKTEELAKVNRYKTEFLANMSHELRSPLNSLLILAKDLAQNKEQNLTSDQIQSSEIIFKTGNDLLMLINDILDFSKIEAGKMNAYVSEFRLDELISNMSYSFKHVAKDKGLDLVLSLSEDLPDTIKTDQLKLEQIIRNLLSNAIRFTSHGQVNLNIYRPSYDIELSNNKVNIKKTIAFSVIDTGIGISEDKQKEIFDAFQQVDNGITSEYGGTGLGLSISKKLANLLSGEIHVNSVLGKGSEFTLFIPEILSTSNKTIDDRRLNKRPQSTLLQATEIKDSLFKGEKIIIVDKDMRDLYALSKILTNRGAEIFKAAKSETAYDILKTQKNISLILLDRNVIVKDGYEVIKQIRSTGKHRSLPIIILASRNLKDNNYISAGADAFISKPVNTDRLFPMMLKLLNKTP